MQGEVAWSGMEGKKSEGVRGERKGGERREGESERERERIGMPALPESVSLSHRQGRTPPLLPCRASEQAVPHP